VKGEQWVIGVDVGLTGGISWTDGKSGAAVPLFYDRPDKTSIPLLLVDRIEECLGIMAPEGVPAFCELPSSRTGESVKSARNSGWVAGSVATYLKSRGHPVYLIHSSSWQKAVLGNLLEEIEREKGVESLSDKEKRTLRRQFLKEAAVRHAESYDINLLATSRSRVPHEGMADAFAIATFGFGFLQHPEAHKPSRGIRRW
jgi:hypothetical protein